MYKPKGFMTFQTLKKCLRGNISKVVNTKSILGKVVIDLINKILIVKKRILKSVHRKATFKMTKYYSILKLFSTIYM